MYTIRIWNKDSTNFDANEFVRVNGTGLIEFYSETAALAMMDVYIHDPAVKRVSLTGPKGHLTWVQHCNVLAAEDHESDWDDPRR